MVTVKKEKKSRINCEINSIYLLTGLIYHFIYEDLQQRTQ